MKKKSCGMAADGKDIVFLPALTPLEASVLPAKERHVYGVLQMIRRAGDEPALQSDQRAKIWVR